MIVLLCIYAAIFPLLTLDTLSKIFQHVGAFQTGNLFLLLYLEIGRLCTTVVAIVLAIWMVSRKRPDARALAVALLFGVIAFEKVFGSNGFPGPVQETVTRSLLARGVPQNLLFWLFGPVAWPVWPALAALLRFSVLFPQPMSVQTLAASGASDRRGLLRGAGMAGADIGAAFRSLSLRLFQTRIYSAISLTVGAVVLTALHSVLRWPTWVSLTLGAFLLCIAVINLRASYLAAQGEDRVRAIWIAQGPLAALFIFLVSGTLLVIAPGTATRIAAFVLIMVVPLVLIGSLALSVLDRGELNSGSVLDETVRIGSAVWAAILVFGAVYAVAPLVVAAFAAALSYPLVKRLTDALSARILEH